MQPVEAPTRSAGGFIVKSEAGYWVDTELGLTRLRRVRRMLLLGSVSLVILGLGWGLFFGARSDWVIVLVDVILVALGLAVARLLQWQRERLASLLLLLSLLFVVCAIAVVFDLPSAAVPRSMHHFLLPLGIASYLLLRSEPPWLRHGMPLACFAAFLFLASSNAGFVTPYALPDSLRAAGTWVNNLSALLALYLLLHIMQSDMAARNLLEADLLKGMPGKQFVLHYQPQVGPQDRILGAEALVRWMHPLRGMILPGEFVALIERSGLILPLGYWVLDAACEQLRAWGKDADCAGLNLAVNVSVHQFRQADFVQRVLAILERTGANPQRLKLELTESVLAVDTEDMIAKMLLLKEHGVAFSLDDFGTGYSSLSYLRRLPLDQLKIDQSFVSGALHDANDAAIIRTVVALGESLGMAVIAEGVETGAQHEFLLANGCRNFQGYLFGRPLPADEFQAMVTQRHGVATREVVRRISAFADLI